MRRDPSAAHLLGRVAAVEERIRRLVAARRADDPQPDDPFRGLYLSDEMVDRLLDTERRPPLRPDASTAFLASEREADLAEAAGHPSRLRELAREFALSPLDVELLLVALAADVDPRFERFFGYLNDDVTQRRPTVGLALELCGASLILVADRGRLLHGPLLTGGLLTLDEPDRALPARMLRVPDRVVGHLLGDDTTDLPLAGVLAEPLAAEWGDPAQIVRALRAGIRSVYLRDSSTGSGTSVAVRALSTVGSDSLVLDLEKLRSAPDSVQLARAAVREVRLRGCGLVAGPVVGGIEPALVAAVDAVSRPTILIGEGAWDASWTQQLPALVQVPPSTIDERVALWQGALGPAAFGVDVAGATEQFRLKPEQVARAAAAARTQAALTPTGTVTADHLGAGARAGNGSALDRLARRVEPAVRWTDLVLPPAVLNALHEIELRARFRERVLGEWTMRPGGGRGHGVVALLAGDSGTGKTMSAEVVAGELGLDLFVVDLATVVDKYIGETEKNLDKIFAAAADVNAVLLFDEADAIFGKRSEVKDAHDRYANVESAFLLQRMESFNGLALLATNLRANIDEAFTRRLDVVVDFPLPDAAHRAVLWDRCLGVRIPRDDDLDLQFLGSAFELAGGAIRAAAVTAAYFAAGARGVLTMEHVITAVQREYRKLGRLTAEREFGKYWTLIAR
ncbi:ATP-binding protein [Microbacterium sp. dk485]|uniref:ATP-binding protein n=1 Tax=Microbacterium sp. dk485 TaxID=2560021 RepID=UPI0010738C67|nr:ATP-binding protein [Microbacterium sp. dk485]TFV81742.1 ATP-binding protein [Microbacterium sp. dk485]